MLRIINVVIHSYYPIIVLINPLLTDSGSDAEKELPDFTKEEEDALLTSDTDEMDTDGASFYSAHSEQGHSTPSRGLLAASRLYNTVRAAKLSAMPIRSLSSNGIRPLTPTGSIVDLEDGRSTRAYTISNFAKRRNIMSSFDLDTLKCITCPLKPGHTVLFKESHAHLNMYHYPSTFVVCDQSFPASIPTGGEGECVKIIRIEDGCLEELASVLLDTIKPFSVPAGTVVLIHSLSHLAWVGAAAYAEDFVRVRQRISAVYRSGISVIHGIPILRSGSNNSLLASDLKVVLTWYNTVRHIAERDVVQTRDISFNMFSAASPMAAAESGQPMAPHPSTRQEAPSTTGQPMAPETPVSTSSSQPMALVHGTKSPDGSPMAPSSCPPMAQGAFSSILRLRLPAALDNQKPEIFEASISNGWVIPAIDEGQERLIIEQLITELNTKFQVGLDQNFSTCLDTTAEESEEGRSQVDYIVVGSSHGCRLVEALRSQGESVYSLADSKWRLSEETAVAISKKLQETVAEYPAATVIFQLYDNGTYYSSTAPGERSLPRKGEDGKYHVPGELVMADWPTFKLVFASSIPLLRAAGKNRKIILSPLPRYIMGRCCKNTDHLKNFGTQEYPKLMGTVLAEMDDWIRDLAYSKRIQNFTAICTAALVDLDDPACSKKMLAKWWGSDPVHMTSPGYEKLAGSLTARIQKEKERETQAASANPNSSGNEETPAGNRMLQSRSGASADRYDRHERAGSHGGRYGRVPPRGRNKTGYEAHKSGYIGKHYRKN